MTSPHTTRVRRKRDRSSSVRVPKLCGADIELANFIQGRPFTADTTDEAARLLLGRIDGVPSHRVWPGANYWASVLGYGHSDSSYGKPDPQCVGRKFLPDSGACAYIDLSHLELCVPETLSAFDHVAAWHALLRTARRALAAANAELGDGDRIQVLVNNSDGLSHSYGSHCSFLLTRRAWNDIFLRKLHFQLFLASCQVSSIVLTGQGKVGSENGAPPVDFQISQRADFFETLAGEQTTYRRPLVNSRDESLCGADSNGLARLHCIFFDNTLCHTSTLLKIGIMQIVLAMIESELVDTRLLLDDPLQAVSAWSHDPTLRRRARLFGGDEVTAVELQLHFFERAQRFAASGGCDGIVPRADEILSLWGDTLEKLRVGDIDSLSGRIDWILKRRLLERTIRQHRGFSWRSPEIKHLDHLYSSLDASEGLYWACERGAGVEHIVSDERVEHFEHHAPEDTRAWTRALLLRAAGEENIERVDWDTITIDLDGHDPAYLVLDLSNPLRFTRRDTERQAKGARNLRDLLDALGARNPTRQATPSLPRTPTPQPLNPLRREQ